MKLQFTPEQLFGAETTFAIIRFAPWYEYVDGKPTDKKLGFRCQVVQQGGDFEKFWVKVAGNPDYSSFEEQLNQSTIPLLAEFRNAVCKLYVDNDKKIQMSVRADGITVID